MGRGCGERAEGLALQTAARCPGWEWRASCCWAPRARPRTGTSEDMLPRSHHCPASRQGPGGPTYQRVSGQGERRWNGNEPKALRWGRAAARATQRENAAVTEENGKQESRGLDATLNLILFALFINLKCNLPLFIAPLWDIHRRNRKLITVC